MVLDKIKDIFTINFPYCCHECGEPVSKDKVYCDYHEAIYNSLKEINMTTQYKDEDLLDIHQVAEIIKPHSHFMVYDDSRKGYLQVVKINGRKHRWFYGEIIKWLKLRGNPQKWEEHKLVINSKKPKVVKASTKLKEEDFTQTGLAFTVQEKEEPVLEKPSQRETTRLAALEIRKLHNAGYTEDTKICKFCGNFEPFKDGERGYCQALVTIVKVNGYCNYATFK